MISVIIVNYHAAELTARAVSSVLQQESAEEVEILVVDNSVEQKQAETLQTRLKSSCRLFINTENQGFGAACNWAYAHSRGEWIFLLNPDAYLLPGALEQLRVFLRNTPKAGAAGPQAYWDAARRYVLPSGTGFRPWLNFSLSLPAALGGAFLRHKLSLTQRRHALHDARAAAPLRQDKLSGGHVLLRREALEKIGGLFDPRFFLYYEDTDLFLRLRRAAYDLYLVPRAEVVHQFNGCAREQQNWKWEQMGLAHRQFAKKHYPRHPACLLRALLKHPSTPPMQDEDLGTLDAPPTLEVPNTWHDAWVLEISLSPYFIPSILHFGSGAQAGYPVQAWRILPFGTHYMRLSHAGEGFSTAMRTYQWRKPFDEQ